MLLFIAGKELTEMEFYKGQIKSLHQFIFQISIRQWVCFLIRTNKLPVISQKKCLFFTLFLVWSDLINKDRRLKKFPWQTVTNSDGARKIRDWSDLLLGAFSLPSDELSFQGSTNSFLNYPTCGQSCEQKPANKNKSRMFEYQTWWQSGFSVVLLLLISFGNICPQK